jgi:cellulose synthase/poly-beta-1,6-N-acetylglucosamine synthase-like glycosyltransferase
MLLTYFVVVWVGYTLSLLLTTSLIIKTFDETKYNDIIASIDTHAYLPITTITPAFNERHRIERMVNSVINANYKNIQMIIVNDGSTDDTLQFLIDTYALKPIQPAFIQEIKTGEIKGYYQSANIPLIVIDKEHSPYANSGADCINAGLNACRTPLFLTLDADTTIEPESISRMLFMFLTKPHCIAIGGDLYVPNHLQRQEKPNKMYTMPQNITLASQVAEYLRSFIYGHEGWTHLGGALCHSGAFTLLEKKAVMDIGAYDASNFSYDAEIIMKLHHYMLENRYPYTIAYASNALAWAESPCTLKGLWRQRNYWQRGLLRCLSLHWKMAFNPRYGLVGLIGFPAYILFEIAGPAIEGLAYITGIVALLIQQVNYVILAWLLCLSFSFLLLITLACMLISAMTYNKYPRKGDVFKMICITFIELIFYRPLRGICCFLGTFHYIFNRIRGKAL